MAKNKALTVKTVAKVALQLAKDIETKPFKLGRSTLFNEKTGAPVCAMGHLLARLGAEHDEESADPLDYFRKLIPEASSKCDEAFDKVINRNDEGSGEEGDTFRKHRKFAVAYEFRKGAAELLGQKEPKVPAILLKSKHFDNYAPSKEV